MKAIKNKFVRTSLFTLMGASMALAANTAAAVDITGAGASFPAPVYAKWADTYQKETGNRVNYQSIGSSGGRKQIIAKTVDFGATDAPMKDEELEKEKLFQFPTVIGGVVLALHLEGIKSGELVLDGNTVADIYLGKVKKWNDEAIKKLNPNLNLPNKDIAVIRRADGSGTTFVFTSYLTKVSAEWKEKIGAGSTVQWAPGSFGGKGNEGVSASIQQLDGAIGYVEYAYAKQNNLPYTSLISADGETVRPSSESFSNAAVGADWNASFAQDLTQQKGANAWPITSATFILLEKQPGNAERAKETLKFFEWALDKGGDEALALDYATLPASVVDTIKSAWKANIVDKDGKALY